MTLSNRIAQSQTYKTSILSSPTYLFLGKNDPWDDDLNPPENSLESETRSGFIEGVKILSSNVANVTRRIDWKYGNIYSQYDNGLGDDLYNQDFYAIGPDFGVYKCLQSRKGPSTHPPKECIIRGFENQNSSLLILPDGYVWTKLYQISLSDRDKFLTKNLMPVFDPSPQDLNNELTSAKTGFYSMVISNSGVNYSPGSYIITNSGGNVKNQGRIYLVVDSDGRVIDYVIKGCGRNDSLTNSSIIDGGLGSGVSYRIIPSPANMTNNYGISVNGHGSSPINELGATGLMISYDFDYASSKKTKFRQTGVVTGLTNPDGSLYVDDFWKPADINISSGSILDVKNHIATIRIDKEKQYVRLTISY